ncbi:MAG: hypothetical protein E4G90_00275 [Gemmatimonadales bacterium]|nr:MAG: hypothetical protein E4G90_00275 [Gemmatimonadales bacterium]
MPDLVIRTKKKMDGSAALSCLRADGSVTWQRREGRLGLFFPLHDLTHYAVETTLGHRKGFYGLVADGWDITDFGAPWPRGPIPPDADPSELIVGFLDAERGRGEEWSASDFNDRLANYYTEHGLDGGYTVSEEQPARIRERARELFAAWVAVRPGDTLDLVFATP